MANNKDIVIAPLGPHLSRREILCSFGRRSSISSTKKKVSPALLLAVVNDSIKLQLFGNCDKPTNQPTDGHEGT